MFVTELSWKGRGVVGNRQSRPRTVLAITCSLFLSCLGDVRAVSQSIYYLASSPGSGIGPQVRSVDTNGLNNQLLVQLAWGGGAFNGINGEANPQQIAVDPLVGVFWTDIWHDRIRHANLDGSGESDVILTGNGEDIHIDPLAGKIYWTEWPQGGSTSGRTLRRSDLNGANSEIVIDNLSNAGPSLHSVTSLASFFAVDYLLQKIYYADTDGIHRVNYDGTSDSLFLATPSGGIGLIRVDSYNHKLFYSPTATGTGVDPSAEQVYEVDLFSGLPSPQLIYDFNIVFNNRAVLGIGLDYHRTRAYMVDQFDAKLGSVGYDGTASSQISFVGLKAFDLLVIPEPTTLLLTVAGGVLLIRRRLRQGR